MDKKILEGLKLNRASIRFLARILIFTGAYEGMSISADEMMAIGGWLLDFIRAEERILKEVKP